MIVIVDNYDSFTYNLVQRFGEIDPAIQLKVVRNDQATVETIVAWKPTHIVISPGPCTPKEAGISVDCVRQFHGKIPLLGVCLGHQSIGAATGGVIARAERLMHGKTDQIQHNGSGIFSGLPNPITATRYHSLIITPETLSDEFEVTAWTHAPSGEREIMAIEHRDHPTFGVQFHPESFLTQRGIDLLKNFIQIEQGIAAE
ncbi:MAG: aminodeoxychorismate/anthranilate synthase component II [Planctomycetota bacterium]